jgi:hypothetical protein
MNKINPCPHYALTHTKIPTRTEPGFRVISRKGSPLHDGSCVNPRAFGAGATKLPGPAAARMSGRRKAPASILTHIMLPTLPGGYRRVELSAAAVERARAELSSRG